MHTAAEASSPAVVGRLLVAHAKSGRSTCCSARPVALLWSHPTEGEIESSPVVDDGVDYLGDWSGHVYALDLRTPPRTLDLRRRLQDHRERRRSPEARSTSATTAAASSPSRAERPAALERADRQPRLRRLRRRRRPRLRPLARHRRALRLHDASGRYLWHVSTGRPRLLGAGRLARPRLLRLLRGDALLRLRGDRERALGAPVGGRISGSPTVVDGVVYVGSFAHRILGADARSGAIVFSFPHGEYVAVSGNRARLLLYGWASLWAVEPRR